MSTPAEIFRPNEIVHAIDESISRWTKAKIIGIVSDWSVKIKWMGYTSIYPSETIEVPEEKRTDQSLWNLRKVIEKTHSSILSREDRRQTPRAVQLEYNPKHCVHDDEVSVSPNNFYFLKISAVKNSDCGIRCCLI